MRPVFASIGPADRPADVPALPLGKADSAPVAEVGTAVASRKADPLPERDASAGASSAALDGNLASSPAINPQNQSAYYDNAPDAAPASSGEGGFIAIEEGTAARRSEAGGSSDFGGDSSDDTTDGLLGDLSLDSLKTARQSADDYSRFGNLFASDTSDAIRAQAKAQPALYSSEAGIIDLADAPPSAVAAADEAGDAAQDASDVRLRSGAGLFCDMEIAVGGSPSDGAESATVSAAANRPLVPRDRPLKDAVQRTSTRQRAAAGPSDNVPLFLGAAVIVLSGGIRLQQDDPGRERRLQSIEQLQNRPRD
jgi:hypothetical protein